MELYRPLSSWVERSHPLPERFYISGYEDIPTDNWAVWLSIEEVSPIHLAPSMEWIGVKESRNITAQYLEQASEIIDGLQGGWLEREEREWILEELGQPPLPSLPIYLITVADEKNEKLVYVGKTVNKSRFSGGHSAALKLNAPDYADKDKKIYRSTVWFHFNEEYITLDWIQPEKLALEILDSVESQLVYEFQPELNTAKKKNLCAKWDFNIHIQNFLKSGFLNDTFI